jgi:alpha-tubulin suppressor-like RCC1 family protein
MAPRVVAVVGVAVAALACADPTSVKHDLTPGQFVAVTAGRSHACAIDTIGRAWCWGSNNRGQTGAPASECTANFCGTVPAPVQGNARFASISAGSMHTCGLTAEGDAYCWGDNGFGQLGAGNVGVCISLVICSDVPLAVVGGYRYKSITAGSYGTCAIALDDVLKCWGYQSFTSNLSLLVPTTVRFPATGDSVWSQVGRTDGGLNGCGITSGGVAACWGQNIYGQVGVGSMTGSRLNPVAIGLEVVVKAISSGGGFTCALSNVGDAYCWGLSTRGGLALGADAASTACGNTSINVCFPTPLKVIGGRTYSQLAVGSDHVCGLDVITSEAWCWGSNALNAIGSVALGLSPAAPSPFAAGFGTKYVSLAAGTLFTCGLMADKNVSCWGSNIEGELGIQGSLFSSAAPVLVRALAP